MADLVVMPKTDWQNILSATKSKSGVSTALKSGEVASKISNIKTTPKLQNKTITENGTYTADSGYDGLGSVSVEVESSGGGGVGISVVGCANFPTYDNRNTLSLNETFVSCIFTTKISQ